MDEATSKAITDAIANGTVVVCYSNCYECMFGQCYDPPQWHTWADEDDIEHAKSTGQPDPSESPCGCPCADAEKGAVIASIEVDE